MTDEEAKIAFNKQIPVAYNVTSDEKEKLYFSCISALICRRKDGKNVLSLELLDKCHNSVLIVEPKNVISLRGGS